MGSLLGSCWPPFGQDSRLFPDLHVVLRKERQFCNLGRRFDTPVLAVLFATVQLLVGPGVAGGERAEVLVNGLAPKAPHDRFDAAHEHDEDAAIDVTLADRLLARL